MSVQDQIDNDTERVILAVAAHKDGCKFGDIGADQNLRTKTVDLDVLLQRVKRRGYIDYVRPNGDGPKVWMLTARGKAEHKRILFRREEAAAAC